MVFLYPVLASLISRLAITIQTVLALCPIRRLRPATAELSISKLVILNPLYSNASILSFCFGSAKGTRSSHISHPSHVIKKSTLERQITYLIASGVEIQ